MHEGNCICDARWGIRIVVLVIHVNMKEQIKSALMYWFIIAVVIVSDWQFSKAYQHEPCQTDTIYIEKEPIPDTIHLERATTYQPTEAQCDSNPFSTADGSIINPDSLQRWVALSRDLLSRWGGPFDYGDTLDIYSKEHPNINGQWVVHDCMNARYKMSVDFLMAPEDNYPKLGVGTDVKIIYCGEL